MNERKKLKKQLAEKYIFKMYLSVNEVKKLLSENPKDKHDILFASLTAAKADEQMKDNIDDKK